MKACGVCEHEAFPGWITVPACGDGCCHEVVKCDACDGTAEVEDDSDYAADVEE